MKTLFPMLLLLFIVISSTNNTFGKTNSDTTKNSFSYETPQKKLAQGQLADRITEDEHLYWAKWYEQNSDFYVTELYTKHQSIKGDYLLLK